MFHALQTITTSLKNYRQTSFNKKKKLHNKSWCNLNVVLRYVKYFYDYNFICFFVSFLLPAVSRVWKIVLTNWRLTLAKIHGHTYIRTYIYTTTYPFTDIVRLKLNGFFSFYFRKENVGRSVVMHPLFQFILSNFFLFFTRA